jgi:hypothetical protein
MENTSERAIGHLLGLVGGLLIIVGGIVAAAFGFGDLILGRALGGATALSEAIVLVVVGALVVLFAHMGEHAWRDRPLASGIMLVVLALIGWGILGFGTNVLALVGGVFALLAGVLYLIQPAQHAASAIVATS